MRTNTRAIFFLDGPSGSGKIFLYNALLAQLRGDGLIAFASTSFEIASLLLKSGQTTHSQFEIPLHLHEASTYNIKLNSHIVDILKVASLII